MGIKREHIPLSEATARYLSYKCNILLGSIYRPHAAASRNPQAGDPARDPRQDNPPYPILHGRWRNRSLNCPTWGRNGRGGKGVALPSKCPLFLPTTLLVEGNGPRVRRLLSGTATHDVVLISVVYVAHTYHIADVICVTRVVYTVNLRDFISKILSPR